MNKNEIKVGETYCNRGKGKTKRTVLAIGPDHLPQFAWNADGKFPEGAVGVQFRQGDETATRCLWLDSFAAWAGKVIP